LALSDTNFYPDALVEAAIEATGFSDFGELPYREGLQVLCETYDKHIRDPAGRKRCQERLINLLSVRLRTEDAFKGIPAIAEQEVLAPLFVTGLPRSGTSALINLLSAAPENRGLLQWEVQFPDPWPDSEPGQSDPRYPYLVKALAANQNPDFQKIHYVDADTPEECVMIHAYAFSGVQLGFEIMLEPYRSWILAQDLEPMYAYQKRQLQMLNWRNPGQRWTLKAPAHMWSLPSILKVFPDARFVWCHRDPLPVVASINSMNQQVMKMFGGDCSHLDQAEIGRAVMEWYAMSLEQGLAARENLPAELFVDCSQQELTEQPMAVLERIYDKFDLAMSDEARAGMQAHINANPKGKHGEHQYDLASYGLTEQEVLQRFEFYKFTGQTETQ
jgi:hypothetical protein